MRTQEKWRKEPWAIAAADERARFNAALERGAVVIITTFAGRYVVTSVDDNFWYHSYPEGSSPRDWAGKRSWAGCNDGKWEDMLKQAGVERNPLWKKG